MLQAIAGPSEQSPIGAADRRPRFRAAVQAGVARGAARRVLRGHRRHRHRSGRRARVPRRPRSASTQSGRRGRGDRARSLRRRGRRSCRCADCGSSRTCAAARQARSVRPERRQQRAGRPRGDDDAIWRPPRQVRGRIWHQFRELFDAVRSSADAVRGGAAVPGRAELSRHHRRQADADLHRLDRADIRAEPDRAAGGVRAVRARRQGGMPVGLQVAGGRPARRLSLALAAHVQRLAPDRTAETGVTAGRCTPSPAAPIERT